MDRDSEFDEFARARWGPLVRLAAVLGCPPEHAEEMAQQTLANCLFKWKAFSSARDPIAYANRMLINAVKDSWKKGGREVAYDQVPAADVEDRGGQSDYESRDHLQRALNALSTQHREVLVLRYYLDYSEAMIADTLGLPPGTVKSRLSRALARLIEHQSTQGVEMS